MSKPSRTALVRWVNETLSLNMSKVDEFGTGAVYCQLIDSIYGDVPMSRVKFGSRLAFDHEQNYKVLHQEFQRHGITRHFDRQKLMQCRLQDNLDFTQWIYAYWHDVGHIADYDPVARRKEAAGHTSANRTPTLQGAAGPFTMGTSMPPSISRAGTMRTHANSDSSRASSQHSVSRNGSRKGSQSSALGASATSSPQNPSGPFVTPRVGGTHVASPVPDVIEVALPEVQTVIAENEDLRQSVDILLAERDLYYEKLTVIEELVNAQVDTLYAKWGDEAAMDRESDSFFIMMRKLQGILYSRPEGFEPPNQSEDEPF